MFLLGRDILFELLLIISFISICAADVKVVNRLNFGVFYKLEYQGRIATNYWLHSYKIELPKLVDVVTMNRAVKATVRRCNETYWLRNNFELCEVYTNISSATLHLKSTIVHDIRDYINDLYDMLPDISKRQGTRKKRSFLGLATVWDLEQNYKMIKEVLETQDTVAVKLARKTELLVSFANLVFVQ
jgi:hypothetical protein